MIYIANISKHRCFSADPAEIDIIRFRFLTCCCDECVFGDDSKLNQKIIGPWKTTTFNARYIELSEDKSSSDDESSEETNNNSFFH